jgi:D-galactarolactone cycloisomerase
MRIADVRTHVFEAKLSQPCAWSFNTTHERTSCLVEIVAQNGTTGWGNVFYLPAPMRLSYQRWRLSWSATLATELHWQHLYHPFRDRGRKVSS